MWKKALGIAMVLISMSVSAFAAIPRDQMHIGGLKLGMTLQQVAAMYGTPVADTSGTKASGGLYYIANGLFGGWIDGQINAFGQFYFDEHKPGADRVVGTGNIRLGMTADEVVQRLGNPDIKDGNTFYYKSVEHGITWREHDMFNVYFTNGRVSSFTINVF